MMTENKMTVDGGRLTFKEMTKKNKETDPINYELAKIHGWAVMINDLMRPTKFRKPTTKGTSVEFDTIVTQEDYDEAFKELQDHVDVINEKYDAQISLNATPK